MLLQEGSAEIPKVCSSVPLRPGATLLLGGGGGKKTAPKKATSLF